ncbi:GNAT family N-acetyltransferase [Cupriavidus numazuensis]|uniref:N-acetyltransferase domain-containing protein n=1 Tax=Cupriavidus numazuensis TaxID=221992 RepID=A0ABM8TBL6_9BURK|nr:GNAT family N-acetyltransferase [Cupriavidus numazuensis]CAG2132560.1 hypothetical protein LMG26411_00638 [Cupriavidus numazuensis]
MITYQVEAWPDIVNEIRPLWREHWEEVGTDRDRIPLDVDEAAYLHLHRIGELQVLTVRRDGAIVGYHIAIVRPHIRYRTTLVAITDVYYVRPDARKGMVGVNLFRQAEKHLSARGAKKLFTGTKKSLDMGPILIRLGYREAESLYTKFIGV